MGRWGSSPDDITSGSVAPTLLVLAAPLVAQNLVHVVNQVVDTFWLGRVDEASVAAVGLNFPLLAVMFGVTAMAVIGTHILVSQRVGLGDEAAARRAVINGVVLAAVLALALAAVAVFAADGIVSTLGAGPEVGPLAAMYLATFAVFFPAAACSDTIERGFIGWGDTRAALYINLLMVGTNVVLDPFLILGWGPFPALGVQGAALATGLGYVVGLLAALTLAFGVRESLTLSAADLVVDRSDLRELVVVGSPLSGQQLAGQSARIGIIAVVATVGGAAGLAAYTVGARIASIAFVPASGFGQAAQSMIGQNLGAERPDRAHATVRVGVLIAGGALGIVGALQWLVPGPLVDLFAPTFTAAGRDLSVDYLQILAYGYPAMGIAAVVLAGFNGASRTKTTFAVDLIKYWGVRIPAAALALPAATVAVGGVAVGGLDWGIYAVFWAVTVSNIFAAVGAGAYYLWRRASMYENAVEEVTSAAADD